LLYGLYNPHGEGARTHSEGARWALDKVACLFGFHTYKYRDADEGYVGCDGELLWYDKHCVCCGRTYRIVKWNW
jgi:hypothetical protein